MPTETIISQVRKKEAFKGLDKIGKFNYNSTRWRKVASLHKKLNPMCVIEGCKNPVHTTDHNPPVIKLLEQGKDPFSFQYLQSLCKHHNASKTSKQRFEKYD